MSLLTVCVSRDCNPGIPGFPNSRIPGSRKFFQSRNPGIEPHSIPARPGISGLTKFIYLMVFLVLFKIILCIYSFFDAFLSPQWRGGRGPSCSGRHAIVLKVSVTERCSKVLQSFVHLPVFRPSDIL